MTENKKGLKKERNKEINRTFTWWNIGGMLGMILQIEGAKIGDRLRNMAISSVQVPEIRDGMQNYKKIRLKSKSVKGDDR